MENPAFRDRNNQSIECRVMRDMLSRIGDKWSLLVIFTLAFASDQQPLRFSELMRLINGISQRMLTTTLRNLEREGFLTRQIYAEVPPRVEYSLTDRGRGLLVPATNLLDWIKKEWPAIEKSRQEYDAKIK